MTKFHCQQCGKCCSFIRGKISKEEKEFIEKYAFGKLPLIQLFPVDKMAFPLFDFEAKRFKKWEQEVNINAKIKPSRVILDLNSNKAIVVTYYMDYSSCPFLKDNKCLIYNKKRAFICRLFPFNKGPFLKTGEPFKKQDMFGQCKAITDIMPKLDDTNRKKIVKQLLDYFQDNFLNILQYDHITEWINKLILKLTKENKIRPAMNIPYKFLKKRIENSEKIDLMDFLIENKIKTKQEVEDLIKRFDNNKDVKEKLEEFLS